MRFARFSSLALALVASHPVMAHTKPDTLASDVMAAQGEQIWSFVREIASDAYEGRALGTPGYDRAAALVAARFKELGLKPAGTQGYFQPIDFVSQKVVNAQSAITLVGPDGQRSLKLPEEAFMNGRHDYLPALDNVPLVFVGYGLSMPDLGAGHDDFGGVDVRGKVVVVITGGPDDVSGARKSTARSERIRVLIEKGALGMISLTTAKQIEIPWSRQIGLSSRAAIMLRDGAARDAKTPFFSASISPEISEALFAGSGHSYAEMAALADASRPLPLFDLAQKISARVTSQTVPLTSANVAAILPGSDKALAGEYVVVSAHLDGLGIGEPVNGDRIYNGALDNGIGVASVLTIAGDLAKAKKPPRRSVLFLIPTGEEAGLLGARYFVAHPTVPKAAMVADINFDMPLPIFPLTSVTPIGYEESTLGAAAQAVSARHKLPVVPDPLPDRNVFIRSDQYNFVRAGIPSLFMKLGFARGTPEEAVEKAWRANIYHSPKDDAQQPVNTRDAARFADYVADLVKDVANAPERPQWHKDSYFAQFAGGK
ncbi:M28 family peptidase [Novosphingobium umbonatum]|uniref:M28 family peptidase n=1 Tax=Novosphingobium umbonatum TaxID=1908524 RepID=A0A3S2YB21_9SPHN|nr:M28 family peptidase [Novosphingobium umbonatum]RVU07577.1 M28 family peptidase [Novosphingobium umbonatum]